MTVRAAEGRRPPALQRRAIVAVRRRQRRGASTRSPTARVDVVAGTAWLWSPGRDARHGRRAVRRRGGPEVAGQRRRGEPGARRAWCCSAIRSSCAQPSKGSHPDGAECSALEHLLDGARRPCPTDRGLFLDGDLADAPRGLRRSSPSSSTTAGCSRVRARAPAAIGAGPSAASRAAVGAGGARRATGTSSPEEADASPSWSSDLVGPAVDRPATASTRPIASTDVLVVAPYNAQVARAARSACPGARVGTVDKFQGQEAAVVIFSMATSSAATCRGGWSSCYDLHRLNVAVSRAKTLAYWSSARRC